MLASAISTTNAGMKSANIVVTAAVACSFYSFSRANAQEVIDDPDAHSESVPTVDYLIETAKDRYRPPGLRVQCTPGEAGEIVVCAPDPDDYRVSSSTDDAIRAGLSVSDGIPRAPPPLDWPPCVPTIFNGFCARVYRPLPRPVLIDLDALPEALAPEVAARVFRVEGGLVEEP